MPNKTILGAYPCGCFGGWQIKRMAQSKGSESLKSTWQGFEVMSRAAASGESLSPTTAKSDLFCRSRWSASRRRRFSATK